MRKFIISGGDSNYFPLLDELAESLRALADDHSIGLAFIDAGLTKDQKEHLSARYGARILETTWEFEGIERRAHRQADKLSVARGFLDRYLPDADLIAWVDGDAWVQDLRPLELMFAAAEKGKLAIVSQLSRYSGRSITLDWIGLGLGLARVRNILYKSSTKARLPASVCRALVAKPTLNAGVFALRKDAPHWDAMRIWMGKALRHGKVFTVDQLALGLVTYLDKLPIELCPEVCNYRGPWRASDDARLLVEYYTPYTPVGVVHMAGLDHMRRDPSVTVEIPTLSGASLQKSLRRFAWRGL